MKNSEITSSTFANVEAENYLIGSILTDTRIVDKACGMLTADMFSEPVNAMIFKAGTQLNGEGKGVDMITVSQRVRDFSKKDQNVNYDIEIVNRTTLVTSTAHWEAYAHIVKQLYIKRQLFEKTTLACSEMRNDACDVYSTMDSLARYISELEDKTLQGRDTIASFTDIVQRASDEMVKRVECYATGEVIGVRTGSYQLDSLIQGWQKDKFIIIGGRTANGKTSFALNAVRTAATYGTPVVFFSLEMPDVEIAQKLISAVGNIPYHRIHSGSLSPAEMEKYFQTASQLRDLPIIVVSESLKIDDIRRMSKALHRRGRCEMVVIDYLQIVPSTSSRDSREREVAYTSRQCKAMANELHIPVIALAQVNREVDKREDTMPRLSDLRESGSIEQDADIVLFVDRRESHIGADTRIEQHISVAKHRAGSKENIILYTNAAMTRYSDQPIYEPIPF